MKLNPALLYLALLPAVTWAELDTSDATQYLELCQQNAVKQQLADLETLAHDMRTKYKISAPESFLLTRLGSGGYVATTARAAQPCRQSLYDNASIKLNTNQKSRVIRDSEAKLAQIYKVYDLSILDLCKSVAENDAENGPLPISTELARQKILEGCIALNKSLTPAPAKRN